MKKNRREYPDIQQGWGWYNFGLLLGVEPRRRDAIAAIENHTGEPWNKAKKYMEVHKVVVEHTKFWWVK